MNPTRTYSYLGTTGITLGYNNVGSNSANVNGANQTAVLTTVKLKHVHGFFYGTGATTSNTQYMLQAFQNRPLANTGESATGPTSTVTVPDWECVLVDNYEFDEAFILNGPILSGPVYFAVSSTAGVYTTPAANNTVDLFIEVESFEEDFQFTTLRANNASTNKLQVWSNASGLHNLSDAFTVDLGNSAGAQLYLMLFAADSGSVVNGAYPIRQWTIPISGSNGINVPNPTTNTGMLYTNFGNTQQGGIQIYSNTMTLIPTTGAAGVSPSQLVGCTLAISTTPTTLTLAAANATEITAHYYQVS